MKISEQFYTLQGEGKFLGAPSYFIRTTGCNLRCAWKNIDGTTTLCDTPYTSWNPEKGSEMVFEELIKNIKDSKAKHIVITGGEPLLNYDLPGLTRLLLTLGFKITIETNGTIYNRDIPQDAFMSISPKTISSYAQQPGTVEAKLHSQNNKFYGQIKEWMNHNDYQLKFVYNDPNDLEEILTIQRKLDVPADKIYLMPQGITSEQHKQKMQQMFNICMKHGFNYTPRLHIDVFGNKRGI